MEMVKTLGKIIGVRDKAFILFQNVGKLSSSEQQRMKMTKQVTVS